jgi:hypothetical protein
LLIKKKKKKKGIYKFVLICLFSHITYNYYFLFILFLETCVINQFDANTKNLIRQIPNASNKEQINKLLQLIKDTNDKGLKVL